MHKSGRSPRREPWEQGVRRYPAWRVRKGFLGEMDKEEFARRSWRGFQAKGGIRTKGKVGQACPELRKASGDVTHVCSLTREPFWLPAKAGVGLGHCHWKKAYDTQHDKP